MARSFRFWVVLEAVFLPFLNSQSEITRSDLETCFNVKKMFASRPLHYHKLIIKVCHRQCIAFNLMVVTWLLGNVEGLKEYFSLTSPFNDFNFALTSLSYLTKAELKISNCYDGNKNRRNRNKWQIESRKLNAMSWSFRESRTERTERILQTYHFGN